jgi:hypothetical protein
MKLKQVVIFFGWDGQFPPAVRLSEATCGFLAALQVLGLPHAWTVLLGRGSLYFLMIPSKPMFYYHLAGIPQGVQ